jgi:predicted regulator of amino acid metabolism with ACT domain
MRRLAPARQINTTTVAERERIKEIVENYINSVQNLILVVPNIGIGIVSIGTASRSAPAILAHGSGFLKTEKQ